MPDGNHQGAHRRLRGAQEAESREGRKLALCMGGWRSEGTALETIPPFWPPAPLSVSGRELGRWGSLVGVRAGWGEG